MRTIGAKNKPKFANVMLSELVQLLQPTAAIPVDINFANALRLRASPILEDTETVEESSIQSERIQFNKITF